MQQLEYPPHSESALSYIKIDVPSVGHEDGRRKSVEIFSSKNITIRDSKVLTVKQPPEGTEAVIGGHWEKGIEIIWVQEGVISTLKLADVKTGEEAAYDNLVAGTRIILPAGIAHQLRFRHPATIFVFNEVPFTPKKLVIYPAWR